MARETEENGFKWLIDLALKWNKESDRPETDEHVIARIKAMTAPGDEPDEEYREKYNARRIRLSTEESLSIEKQFVAALERREVGLEKQRADDDLIKHASRQVPYNPRNSFLHRLANPLERQIPE